MAEGKSTTVRLREHHQKLLEESKQLLKELYPITHDHKDVSSSEIVQMGIAALHDSLSREKAKRVLKNNQGPSTKGKKHAG